MEKIFLSVLNMSLTSSFIIAAICAARLLLKKAPKIISYTLWAVAGFRLVFPFTLESTFSLLPFKSQPIPTDITTQAVPRINSGIAIIDNAVSSSLPAATLDASANPLQLLISIGSYVWLLGIAVMLIYSFVSSILLKHRLRGAVPIESNLYEADNLKTPFVIGLFRARIYIPAGLSGEERRYIVLHEQSHIRRHDHSIKMLAFFVLCLHWFNPLAWIAFILMGADMEMSCDERVMRELGKDIKNAYSMSLVRLAAGRRILNGSPLAFGEGGMKERVKNVLNFKKHSRVIIVTAVALAAVLSLGFAVDRISDAQSLLQEITGATHEQAKQIESHLAEYGVSYQAIAHSINPITVGMDTDWQAYDLFTENGSAYVLILRKSDNDFTAVLDDEGRLISGLIDNVVTPALFIDGKNKFDIETSNDEEGILNEDSYIWPLADNFQISTSFGTRIHPIEETTVSHDGIDLPAPGGTPVLAAKAGTVIETDYNVTDGFFIKIDHGGGQQTFYAHLSKISVQLDDTVLQGDTIGDVGSTGKSTGSHLHFGMSIDGVYINPLEGFDIDTAIRESNAKMFSVYEQYGLIYSKEANRLYYNNELVRYFEDNQADDGTFNGTISSYYDGSIDLYAVRDSAGNLIGIELYNQEDFAERTISIQSNKGNEAAISAGADPGD